MNPNLRYAQHVPGARRSPPWGIIRGRRLVDLIDATTWLSKSNYWTARDDKAWREWLSAYLD